MKLAITSTGNQLQAPFDMRFGRTAWFCIFDTDTNGIEFIENGNKNANGGAGTKAAERMAECGVTKVISGDFGPKARMLLEQFKIQMIMSDDKGKTVQDIVNRIMKEK